MPIASGIPLISRVLPRLYYLFANTSCSRCSFSHCSNGKAHKFHTDSFHRTIEAWRDNISLLMLPQLPLWNHLLLPNLHTEAFTPCSRKHHFAGDFCSPQPHHRVTGCDASSTLPSFTCTHHAHAGTENLFIDFFWWKCNCKRPEKEDFLFLVSWCSDRPYL